MLAVLAGLDFRFTLCRTGTGILIGIDEHINDGCESFHLIHAADGIGRHLNSTKTDFVDHGGGGDHLAFLGIEVQGEEVLHNITDCDTLGRFDGNFVKGDVEITRIGDHIHDGVHAELLVIDEEPETVLHEIAFLADHAEDAELIFAVLTDEHERIEVDVDVEDIACVASRLGSGATLIGGLGFRRSLYIKSVDLDLSADVEGVDGGELTCSRDLLADVEFAERLGGGVRRIVVEPEVGIDINILTDIVNECTDGGFHICSEIDLEKVEESSDDGIDDAGKTGFCDLTVNIQARKETCNAGHVETNTVCVIVCLAGRRQNIHFRKKRTH